MLQWMYCRGNLWTKRSENNLDQYWIGGTWAACRSGLCRSTFDNIYVSESADLNVHVVEGWNDSDGGVRPKRCRWSDGRQVACFLYDMDRREGYTPLKGTHLTSASSVVLPVHPFISFTDKVTRTRFAVWPKVWPRSTALIDWPTTVVQPGSEVVGGTVKTIFRAAPQDTAVRAEDPIPGAGTISQDSNENRRITGWFDNTVDGHSLEVRSCTGSLGLGNQSCFWVNLNTGATTPVG